MQIKVYTIEFKLPRWVKRTLLFAGIPIAVLLGVGAAVRAAATFPVAVTTFSVDEILSADKLNTNLTTLRDGVNALNTSVEALKASSLTAGRIRLATRFAYSDGLQVAAGAGSIYYPSPDCSTSDNEFVVGGGCQADTANQWSNAFATESLPEGAHWKCAVKNNTAGIVTMVTWVVCGKIAIQ